jgi:hypothetical protein
MAEPKDTVASKARKVVTPHTNCGDGTHTFIVTKWTTTGGYQKATHMACRHCLMPIEFNEGSQDWVVNGKWLKETSGNAQ